MRSLSEQAARAWWLLRERGIVGEEFPTFIGGASWLAEYLLSDDNVEKAVKDAVRREMRSRTYDRHAYDEEVFEEGVADIARAALRAVLSEGEPQ